MQTHPPARLVTERLVLRPWEDRDYEPFADMSMDPRVARFLPPFADRAACHAFVDRLRATFETQGWGFWALEHKTDGLFAGTAGMHTPGPEFGVGRSCVEIGWRLAPAFWRQGLATEAARAILRFGFEVLDLPEIVSFAAVDNERSLNVMQRLGMTFEKNFDLLLLPQGHPGRPHRLYVLHREAWRAINGTSQGTSL